MKTQPKKVPANRANSRLQLLQPAIIAAVMDMLALRWRETDITKRLEASFGRVFSERAVMDLIHTARAQMVLASKKSKEQAFAESVGFYEGIIRNSDVEAKLKIAAQTRLDALFALEPARTNPGLDPESIAEKLRAVARDIDACTAVK